MCEAIADVEELEDLLSEPSPAVVETLRAFTGDLIVLGVGGQIAQKLRRPGDV